MVEKKYCVKDIEGYYYRFIGNGFLSEVDCSFGRDIKVIQPFLYTIDEAQRLLKKVNWLYLYRKARITTYHDPKAADTKILLEEKEEERRVINKKLKHWEQPQRN